MPNGSDFHLKTELPEEGRTERMAEAFEAGLRHCATDPLVRLKMILGETYAARQRLIEELRDKLSRENTEVRELAERMVDDASILIRQIRDPDVANAQLDLLGEALDPPRSGRGQAV